MTKSTSTYWNTLDSVNQEHWTPVRGLEGMAEELTLSIDQMTGEYTRLTRFFPGANTSEFGAKTHSYPEEIFIVSGHLYDQARNVLGFKDAQHAEYDPSASSLFISQLACSLAGREMLLNFVPESQVAAIYGSLSAKEQYYCNFGINPNYIDELKQGPLNISGSDTEGEIRIFEHPGHPFFIGTLFVPQTRSAPEQPHPLVTAFLGTVNGHAD